MSFREKRAWISFIGMLIFGLLYVPMGLDLIFELASGHIANFLLLAPAPVAWFWIAVLTLIAFSTAAHLALVIQSPRDARTPADERERLIAANAVRPAYVVLLLGGLAFIIVLHTGQSVFVKVYYLGLCLWLAQLIRHGLQLFYFRRGV